ncbi:MAG TPA: hypothetical protein VJT73_09380 [Polyangiaceae bacterium]|nr:hypothetical protein [Polyangiaceae bacterium]
MHLPTYELPPLAGGDPTPYAWPITASGCPWPMATSGCPIPNSASQELAIAGALVAQQAGEDYVAISGYLGTKVGELVAGLSGYSPWEEGITGSIFGKILKSVTHAAAALVHGVRQFNPVAIAQMAAIKARALAGSLKDTVAFHVLRTIVQKSFAPALAVIRSAAPILRYAQTVASFVPGIGTGIGAALGAAQVLADGRPISDIAVGAIRGAIPGGPLAQSAFDVMWKAAKGQRIDTAVLSAMRDRIPGGELVKRAADTAIALAVARTAQDRKRALQGGATRAVLSQMPHMPGVPRALPRFV